LSTKLEDFVNIGGETSSRVDPEMKEYANSLTKLNEDLKLKIPRHKKIPSKKSKILLKNENFT